MGDILVNAAEYSTIRNALGVDSTYIPDALVEDLNFIPFVEAEVKAQVTDWASVLAGEDLDSIRLKLGVAYWVAARLCGYLERQESLDFSMADYSQKPTDVDWSVKARELSSEAAKHLFSIAGQTPTGRVTLFKVAGPTRSESRVPTDWEGWLDRIEPTVIDWLADGNE